MVTTSSADKTNLKHNVVPDLVDLRDREYRPPIGIFPRQVLEPEVSIPVLSQGETNACTGFALASVVYYLQCKAHPQDIDGWDVSPHMIYSMARRYDEFPGDPNVDNGSSLRGALKGWYKHGACAARLWQQSDAMPEGSLDHPEEDWWMDAMKRPLGAYYRIDTRSVTDMQVALNEAGILYASAVCHNGWKKGFSENRDDHAKWWAIPRQKAVMSDGGHAFAIVGYNSEGFIIHNSWDTKWGTGGRALLTYNDWLDNAMDCWVTQLGVITDQHLELATSQIFVIGTDQQVALAADPVLRARQVMPFIIDMENNGQLSNTGDFRTQDSDVELLIDAHLRKACNDWGLTPDMPVDIAIFAHGGLVGENSARKTAEHWIPRLYNSKVFPIYLMWETDILSTLINMVDEFFKGQPRLTGSWRDNTDRWWNERLERLLSVPGSSVWDEMKENANAVTGADNSGGLKLFSALKKSSFFREYKNVRLHLVGHSAGAILHSYLIKRWLDRDPGLVFESVNFMAPAVRIDSFENLVVPHIGTNVRRYNQFHLSEDMEQKDPTCRLLAGYSRSLLYFVSRSLEHGAITPLLGLQKHLDEKMKLWNNPNMHCWPTPGKESKSVTHGGFNEDDTTVESVTALLRDGNL